MANKKRIATSVAAVATAAALLLGGTFAWQSISQTALNEASDIVNPGGRLHDDFNGSDKNVYVENFAEDEIFARVRFDEYFEIVMNHGTAAEKTETITVGATRDDPSTYVIHKFDADNPTDEYWDWTMGGQDPDAGDVYYMPTFNLNKDSLAADVNGVFNGANFDITDKDGTQYVDTYVEWTDGATKEGYEIYDGDTNNVDELYDAEADPHVLQDTVNDIIENGTDSVYYNADNLMLTDAKEEHTAAQVNPNTGFIAMADWDGTSGPFWVYDTDGWCYWAQPIGKGETTGLLMDGIALDEVMDDTWYYAINVVGQFITANDIGDGTAENPGFMQDGMTDAAKELLKEIGVDVDGTGEDGGEGEYEYTQETIDELDVRNTASMDVYRGTQYTITYAYDGDADLDYVDMSSADGDHLSSVSYDGDEIIITVHPEEPNDTLTLTYGFYYDDEYELTMTLNVLGDIGEGEGYLEPTDTLPVINITWSEETGNTASANVYRGEIYDFAGFQYVGMDATVHNETLELSGGDEEARSYVGFDEYNNPLLVIEADEPNDTLLLTGSANMDETFDFVITLTVLDNEGGGESGEDETPSWMPEFTKDDTIVCVTFSQHGAFVSDAAEALYFEGQWSSENDDVTVANATLTIYDADGKELECEANEAVTSDGTIAYIALTNPIEGVQPDDKFYAVATYELDDVIYGNSWMYTWSDLANHVTFIGTNVNEENMFTTSVESVYLFDENGEMFDLKGDNDYDMVVKDGNSGWIGHTSIRTGSMSTLTQNVQTGYGNVCPTWFGVVTGAEYDDSGEMTSYTELVWSSDVYYAYGEDVHTYVETVEHNGVKYFVMRNTDGTLCLAAPEILNTANSCTTYETNASSVESIDWDNITETCKHDTSEKVM